LRIDTEAYTENEEEIIHTLTSDKEHDNQSKNYYTTSHNRMRVKQLYFLLYDPCLQVNLDCGLSGEESRDRYEYDMRSQMDDCNGLRMQLNFVPQSYLNCMR
jgi:hypothetical protein